MTIVRRGLIDHSDSLGATARFGHGDVQWLTAGEGIVHSEMFPLLAAPRVQPARAVPDLAEPAGRGQVGDAVFHDVLGGRHSARDAQDDAGRITEVTLVAGQLGDVKAPPPPPSSWAARAEADLAIWTTQDGAAREVDPAGRACRHQPRAVLLQRRHAARWRAKRRAHRAPSSCTPDREVLLENGDRESEFLLLQGRPIGEPVAQYGPFVMNTQSEIQQAFADYRRTQFGGWPWDASGPVHSRAESRFARHADGRVERP